MIADTEKSAWDKLKKKYGTEEISKAEIWPWESDDYYDYENPDVLNVYDC